jgi:hypothetical protein
MPFAARPVAALQQSPILARARNRRDAGGSRKFVGFSSQQGCAREMAVDATLATRYLAARGVSNFSSTSF